jgi:glycosyltransferase involved in cell wall biosynthesis
MSFGAIPVSTTFAASRDMLGGGERGLLYRFGDAESLADALAALAAEDGTRVSARIASCHTYASAHTVEDYGDLVDEVVTGRWHLPGRSDRPSAPSTPGL